MGEIIKKCFVDVETTGLDPKINGIIQISGCIEITNFQTKETVQGEFFDLKCKPIDGDVIEDTALEVNGVTRDQIETYPTAEETYCALKKLLSAVVDKYNKLDKMHFIGYNAQFDSQFIREWFAKLGDPYYGSWFWTPTIDVMTIAGCHFMRHRNTLPNFKLFTVAKALGITVDEARLHDARYDIEITREMYYLVVKEMRA